MAQRFLTTSGSLIIPGAYAEFKVAQQNSGLGTSGVIALVGEADSGPRFSLETDLEVDASFGPDQMSAIAAKYGSGPLVDAARVAVSASNDAGITGAPSRIILVKTNASTKASLAVLDTSNAAYGTVWAKLAGRAGNLISLTTTNTTETAPSTGSFTWIPNVASLNCNLRQSGAAVQALTVAANRTPAQFVSDIDALSGIDAVGGAARVTAQSIGTLAVAVSGANITLSYFGSTFSTTPSAGDTLVLGAGSVIKGALNKNIGAYVVTSASSTVISATKLSDAGAGGAVAGVITAPEAVTAVAVSGTVANDMVVYAPVTYVRTTAPNPLPGLGRTLEIAELSTGTDLISRCLFAGSTTAVTWLSKSASPKIINSSAEATSTMNVARASDGISETITAGGRVALILGYTGITATVVITATTLTTAVVGGSGTALTLNLSDYATIADLSAYIAAQPGYVSSVALTSMGQKSPTSLDRVTANIATTFGVGAGRIKMDAQDMFDAIVNGSSVIQLGDPTARATAGLPGAASTTFLGLGAKGGSLTSDFSAGLDALNKVSCNFVVTLVSNDAATDIADNLTESTSLYVASEVNLALRTHILNASKLKARRPRQGFASLRGTFSAAKDAAQNLASARVSVNFQDIKVSNAQGTVVQFRPWMGAALTAGMQAAGFYRPIFHKFLNISGALQAAADFSDKDNTQLEDALLAGLVIIQKHPSGGYMIVSDQTSYSRDDNFVYNSIQAMYVADTIAQTAARRMEDAFVGQSVADITASSALTFLESIFADFRRLKLISVSDDAPLGFRNAKVTISGPAMIVEAEVKLAGAIYFIPLSFLVSAVTQVASQ